MEVSDGTWSSSGGSGAPGVSLSAANLNFGSQAVGTNASQTLTVTNIGSAPLSVTSVQLSGTNASDFTATNGCTSVTSGGSCSIVVTFDPAAAGNRTATLSITDNATGSPQTVALSGTGSSGGITPTTFTTYLGTYGSGAQTFTGTSAILPLRCYLPSGAAGITILQTNFNPTAGGATEYAIYAEADGSGGFTLLLSNGVSYAPSWPPLELMPSGTTVTLPTPVTLGTMQITAYRFALAGDELQLDLSVTRTGSFNDQIVILGIQGQNYSSPWNVSSGQWSASGGTGAPGVSLSATNLNFGSQTLGSSSSQTLTVTNNGSAPLSITSVQISGTNAGDFTESNGCTSSVAAGGSCSIAITFDPAAAGSRTATLSITDNASGSPQTVGLSGTGSSLATPTTFTTYLGTYGSGAQTFTGTSAILPLRCYLPSGAAGITILQTNFNPTAGGATEYAIYAEADGSGGFTLLLSNGVSYAPPWPPLELMPSGTTVTLPTPVTLGTMQITAYRFALAGNEFQLDLSVTRTGTFNDQIVIFGIEGQNYSAPWGASDGVWSN